MTGMADSLVRQYQLLIHRHLQRQQFLLHSLLRSRCGGVANPYSYSLEVSPTTDMNKPISRARFKIGTATSYTIGSATPLIPATQYWYRITAIGACNTRRSDGQYAISTECPTPQCQPPGFINWYYFASSDSLFHCNQLLLPMGYIIVADSNGVLTSGPINGVSPIANGALGGGSNGRIVGFGSATTPLTPLSIATTGALLPNTLYTITVYSYNNTNCSSGPVFSPTGLTGTITTCAPAPTLTQGTVNSSSIQLNSIGSLAVGNAVPYSYLLNVYSNNSPLTAATGYPLAGIPFTSSSFLINYLNANTPYYYQVTTLGAGTCSTPGTVVGPVTTSINTACATTYNTATVGYNTTTGLAGTYPVSGTIPSGITGVQVSMAGGSGGSCSGATTTGIGGFGGTVQCIMSVSGGQQFNVYVGSEGTVQERLRYQQLTLAPEVRGGGLGGNGGAGGQAVTRGDPVAAAAAVLQEIRDASAHRLIVAGGGGGGAKGLTNRNGGNGGSSTAPITVTAGLGTGGGFGTTGNASTGGTAGGTGATAGVAGGTANGGAGGADAVTKGGCGGGGGGGGFSAPAGGGAANTTTSNSTGGGGGGTNFTGGSATNVTSIITSATAAAAAQGFVTITMLPVTTHNIITTGSSYCAGSGANFPVGLDVTDAGVTYELIANGITTGTTMTPGAGTNITFNAPSPAIPAGTAIYVQSLVAITGFPCTTTYMSGNTTITVNSITCHNSGHESHMRRY